MSFVEGSTHPMPLAIVGVACRFPGGADTPEGLWRLLEEGVDAIGTMPPGRFDTDRFTHPESGTPGKMVTVEGGFLRDIDRFDAAFFGISPREARKIDPQHRLLLELAWEAMEDGGIVPSSLSGRRTGVYVGIWTGEYENVMYRLPDELDFHSVTGGGRYSASGRLSYCYDLRGPCVTVDSGCSASLAALHTACQALRVDEIDAAVVGAANLILQPHVSIAYSRSGMLSAGARCRFGDANAGGYVRSDGAAVVVLKRLDRALADRDLIRGIVLGTGVNADGSASGQLATPSAVAQRELLETVYARAGVDPTSVPYVEAHGTGTKAGDPVELESLGTVLGRDRPDGNRLLVGSVKSNIGHTEACAGLAGLIKTVMVLERGWIPASLHFQEPNPNIPWDGLSLAIPPSGRPWPDGAPRVAGVSSFGITGTNAHAILTAHRPHEEATRPDAASSESPRVVTLSGRSEEAVYAAGTALGARLEDGPPLSLEEVSYTTTCRREHLPHRAAAVVESVADLVDVLGELDADEGSGRLVRGVAPELERPRVAFVFSGQGSQWVGMGRELMTACPEFAATITEAAQRLECMVDWSLEAVLAGQEPLDSIDVIQPTLAIVQIGLARQLGAWGVRPDAVLGHSMGEVPAAHVAGALSLEDALRVLVTRSRLLAEIAGRGAMALADQEPDKLEMRLKRFGDRLSVAAVNGPRSTVVSGDPDAVDELVAELEGENVFARRVNVDVASHSAQTEPLLERLAEGLRELAPGEADIAFHSTVRAGLVPGEQLDARYWTENLRRPVRLDETVRALMAEGVEAFVEIAPHPVLLSSLGDIAAASGGRPTLVSLLRREEPETRRLLEATARLHVTGVEIDWHALAAPDARPVRLPHYPWQRESFWLEQWEDWSRGDGSARRVTWPEEAGAWLYGLEWVEAHAPESDEGQAPGRWLVVGGPSPLAEALVSRLGACGHEVVSIRVGADARGLDELHDLLRSDADPFDGITFLSEAIETPSDSFDHALLTCDILRRVVQAVQRMSGEPRVLLATTGSQNLPGSPPTPAGVAGASLWGFGRVVRDEHPELDVILVDLDPGASAETNARVLGGLVGRAFTEPDVAVRDGTFWAPRLDRLPPPPAVSERERWPDHGTTLITGGLGDLGVAVARHLVQQGVRRLVLLSRTPLPPRSEWSTLDPDTATGARVAAVLELEDGGASVHVGSVDVGDVGALERFVADWASEAWPPIVAVIHTAGVIDSHLVKTLDLEALERVFRGKVGGAIGLDRVFPDVERFVLFSSTSVVVPQAGEANYAAANAYLDALAAERRARGLEAQVVNFGVWRGSGVIANEEGARYVEEVQRQGIGDMPPDVAVRILDRIAASDVLQSLVAPVDWNRLRETRGVGHIGRVFERLVGSEDAGQRTSAVDGLAALSATERPVAIRTLLRDIVARILGVTTDRVRSDATLGSQGLDSLMALELRNHVEGAFDLKVSATLAWNYPTVGKLADHLLERLEPTLSSGGSGKEAGTGPTPDGDEPDREGLPAAAVEGSSLDAHVAEVAVMSDADALRELRGEI